MNHTPNELGQKIKEARDRQAEGPSILKKLPGASGKKTSHAMAVALRAGTELISAVIFGGFLGYWADKLLGTTPLMMIAMVFVGFIAGFLNIYRSVTGQTKNEEETNKDKDGSTT